MTRADIAPSTRMDPEDVGCLRAASMYSTVVRLELKYSSSLVAAGVWDRYITGWTLWYDCWGEYVVAARVQRTMHTRPVA